MVTPQIESPDIARKLGIPKLYFKREDLHPYGSHKGRSIPIMIDMKVAEGAKDFAISSSGNAALAALRHIKKRNAEGDKLTLSILVGERVNQEKLQALESELAPGIQIEKTPRPLQSLFNLIKGGERTSLRQSTDPEALIGYKNLAAEIAATDDLEAVFIATSSGTTAEALANYFVEHSAAIGTRIPQLHIVQTTSVSPISRMFAESPVSEKTEPELSLADAIIDKVAHRADAVVNAIRTTAGRGWIASNADILAAQRLLKEHSGIDATPNGALSLAGLLSALRTGITFKGSVVCVITGR